MYALVESGSITKYFNYPKGFTLGDLQYSGDIFTKWTASELAAIGIYEVTFDNSNKKDEQWYINTNQTFTYDASAKTVTATYGTATAKKHADTLWTSQDKTDGKIPEGKDVGDVAIKGLKTVLIENIKAQAAGILKDTDWYIVRKADAGTAVPSSIITHRAAVRTKAAAQETQITNASNTPALKTLYVYVNTGTEKNPVYERPLGELPTLES